MYVFFQLDSSNPSGAWKLGCSNGQASMGPTASQPACSAGHVWRSLTRCGPGAWELCAEHPNWFRACNLARVRLFGALKILNVRRKSWRIYNCSGTLLDVFIRFWTKTGLPGSKLTWRCEDTALPGGERTTGRQNSHQWCHMTRVTCMCHKSFTIVIITSTRNHFV